MRLTITHLVILGLSTPSLSAFARPAALHLLEWGLNVSRIICDKQLDVEEGQRHFDHARHILNSVPEINTKYGGMLNLYEE